MFCPHCGSTTVDTHGICQNCGKETFDSSTDLEIQSISVGAGGNCPKCGAPLEAGELFCGQCGAQIGENLSTTSLVESPPVRATTSRRLKSRMSPAGEAQREYWEEEPLPEGYDAPTEMFRRATPPRPSLRQSPSGGLPNRGPAYRTGAMSRLAGEGAFAPEPRSPAPLIIGLLCFLASFLTGGAAIWLAVTSLR